MNLDLVITQLKTLVAVFNGNVAGAAGYANGVNDQVWLPLPAAYVVPLDEDAEANDDLNALFQNVRERFQVIVVFDNSVDRRGQTVTALYEPVKFGLLAAVLNWRPNSSVDNPGVVEPTDTGADRSAKGLYYGGGALMSFDRGRLMYSWTFCLDSAISDADGWQPASDPLTDISIAVPFSVDDPTTTTAVVVDVPLPQT